MDEHDVHEERQLTVKNKVVFTIAVLSLLFLVTVVAIHYKKPVYKEFAEDNFYVGTYGTELDPKAEFEKMSLGTNELGLNSCSTTMTKGTDVRQAGRYMWIQEGIEILDAGTIDGFAADGDPSVIAPYMDGEKIISPAKLTFVNSNINQENTETVYIAATINNRYLIRWDNVKSWWCHIGKSNPKKHSDVVGNKGIYSVCNAGYIIGEATSDTTVSLYSIDSNGNTTPISVSELFY